MQINCSVTYSAGDDVTMSADEAAEAVLKALAGDESIDSCFVTFSVREVGQAGAVTDTRT